VTPPLLDVRGIEAGYNDLSILKDCSLEVRAGEVVALVGPNGAGKSTLLKTLSGLVPARAGAVRLDGERIDGLTPYAIAARGVALVPEGRRLFVPLTVRENLELGAFLPRARARQEETLRLIFGLFPTLQQRQSVAAGDLSGGEQQMLALARALMTCPRLLCLDDPFLGLAPPVTRRFSEALGELTARGMTILAAGQHVRRLLRLADRAYLLEEGRVTLSGSGPGLLRDERLRRALLELTPDVER